MRLGPSIRDVLTYSKMATFQNCRRRYKYRYGDCLVPLTKARALRFGTVTHEWLEVWHGTHSLEQVLAAIDRAYIDRFTEPNEKRDWHYQTAMARSYAIRFAHEDFKILELEKEFSGPLVNPATGRRSRSFLIRGKVDGAIRRDDEVLLLEHKTAATLTGDYVERLVMDLQIQLYAHYARESLGLPVTSILYNVLVKPRISQAEGESEEQFETRRAALVAKSKTGTSSAKRRLPETDQEFQARLAEWFAAEPRFTRIELLLDFDSIDSVRQQIWDIGQEILAARRGAGHWHQNGRACFVYGTCPYFSICASKGNPLVIANHYEVSVPHPELSSADNAETSF